MLFQIQYVQYIQYLKVMKRSEHFDPLICINACIAKKKRYRVSESILDIKIEINLCNVTGNTMKFTPIINTTEIDLTKMI